MRILLIILLSANVTFSQKLITNKTDEFTGAKIKETSWEYIVPRTKGSYQIQIRQIDTTIYLYMKCMGGFTVVASSKNDPLMLKTNDTVVKLYPTEYQSSCIGCGTNNFGGSKAWGLSQTYIISKDTYDILYNYGVLKLRIYLTDSYIEEKVKEEDSMIISNMLKIIKKAP